MNPLASAPRLMPHPMLPSAASMLASAIFPRRLIRHAMVYPAMPYAEGAQRARKAAKCRCRGRSAAMRRESVMCAAGGSTRYAIQRHARRLIYAEENLPSCAVSCRAAQQRYDTCAASVDAPAPTLTPNERCPQINSADAARSVICARQVAAARETKRLMRSRMPRY